MTVPSCAFAADSPLLYRRMSVSVTLNIHAASSRLEDGSAARFPHGLEHVPNVLVMTTFVGLGYIVP